MAHLALSIGNSQGDDFNYGDEELDKGIHHGYKLRGREISGEDSLYREDEDHEHQQIAGGAHDAVGHSAYKPQGLFETQQLMSIIRLFLPFEFLEPVRSYVDKAVYRSGKCAEALGI